MVLQEGEEIPDFEVENQKGEKFDSSETGDALIYFYPKAGTRGCTKEACNFRDNIKELEKADITVYGVSTDSVEKQKKFHEDNDLNFDLLADADKEITKKFGVLRTVARVAERTSFLVKDGRIEKVFRKVDPDDHIDEVLEYLDRN